MSIAISALVLLFCGIQNKWSIGLTFAPLFLVTGFLRIRTENKFLSFLLNAFWGILCIFLSCCIPTEIVSEFSLLDISLYRILMNMVAAAIIYGACLLLTGRIKSAVALASGLLLVLSILNGFIYQFRGTEFKPSDIFFVQTAWNVAGQYSFKLSAAMTGCICLWAWMVFFLGALPSDREILPKVWIRLGAAAAVVLCTYVLTVGYQDIRFRTWINEGTEKNGYFLNFAAGIRDAIVEKPEGYSEDMIAQLEDRYPSEQADTEQKSLPNIIVIMNESYADLRIFGKELHTNQPISPFIESLQENTVRGYALTSIFGGSTANAEYEFLTGNTMAFMPDGSVPYQQHIYGEKFSLSRLLQQYGYQTAATHPYLSSGWNRTNIYSFFGFSEMTFQDDYPQPDFVRDYISDREMYNFALQRLDKSGEEPLFLFGITMQNHGGYGYSGPDFEQSIYLEDSNGRYPHAEQYLSLLHETDKATEQFLKQLENYPEDTVVLFFGDHLPRLDETFYQDLFGGSYESLSEQMLQYTVPFFIWANYDIPEKTIPCTSLNYLSRHLLEAAGIPLSAYHSFLKELESQIPAINTFGYYSVSQQTYLPLEEAEGLEAQWLNWYEILQYNYMFDKKNCSPHFFS